jgi:HKD family nuclease
MKTDLTFFTNEPGSTLLDRFRKTLKDVKQFDILVGFFRTSGFFNLYQSFETIDIRWSGFGEKIFCRRNK